MWTPQPLRLADGSPAVDPSLRVVWAGTVPTKQGYASQRGDFYVTVRHPFTDVFSTVDTCELLRSSDLGATWTVLTTRATAACIISLDPSAPDVMYGVAVGYIAQSNAYVLKSLDGGKTWDRLGRELRGATKKV